MAQKLEVIDGKQTNWQGLWFHKEYNGYSSACINLAELRKFKGNVRLYVRKNKFYDKNSKTPNYNFCLKDANSEIFNIMEICKDDDAGEWYWSEQYEGFTIYEGYWCSKCNYGSGYNMTAYCPNCGVKMINGERIDC